MTPQKPPEATWSPLTGMPAGAENWILRDYKDLVQEWNALKKELTDKNTDRTLLDIWLAERRRAFAIETGQIEGLYTLKRGVTEQLITEGFENVIASHTVENIEDNTIKGLLQDQEAALEMIFDDIKENRPLGHYNVKSWHQLLTRHQETVTALIPHQGRMIRGERPFERKGQYKEWSNNPRRDDGIVHEYCPPEHVQAEMDRLFELYEKIREKNYPTHVEAGWLHHRFVRTHPFQDGNGRVSRQLMAYVYLKRGEVPPIIATENKLGYIFALEEADRGNLKQFCDLLGDIATTQLRTINAMTKNVLKGNQRLRHANGGVTNNGKYYPPKQRLDRDPADG